VRLYNGHRRTKSMGDDMSSDAVVVPPIDR
jgi:hypothetical protein